jgi:peptidase T. Metallo peptidase. MEROPS family M20B
MDGEELGEVEMETFSADSMTITFEGFNTHPGFGKGKLINSIKIAGDFLSRLPKDRLSPETTEKREGFVHPYVVDAAVEKTSVKFLIRDFVTAELKTKEAFLEKLAKETVAAWPGAAVVCKVDESYRNMKEVLDKYPQVVENAREAVRRAGLELREAAIRGGTDGSRLSFMGLPTRRVRGRAQLPLAARVDLGPGHGEGGRGDRQPGEGLGRSAPAPSPEPGRAGTARLRRCRRRSGLRRVPTTASRRCPHASVGPPPPPCIRTIRARPSGTASALTWTRLAAGPGSGTLAAPDGGRRHDSHAPQVQAPPRHGHADRAALRGLDRGG